MPSQTTSSARAKRGELFRKLPSIDELARSAEVAPLVLRTDRPRSTTPSRTVLGRLRDDITAGKSDSAAIDLALSGIADAIEHQLRESLNYSLRPVINATGVILHTNLGRAPLALPALDHVRESSADLL